MRGYDVEIFSTSESEFRFTDLAEALRAGDDWQQSSQQHSSELREYLSRAITDSSAYLLLLTTNSVRKSGPWIRFEIHAATRLARERQIPFVPCLRGVGYDALMQIRSARPGSKWEETDVGAPPAEQLRIEEWQAAPVDTAEQLEKLISDLATALHGSNQVNHLTDERRLE